jgi:hypothetical protein
VSVDLSPYAPGPVQVRFRMLADDFLGLDGWIVDGIRVTGIGGTTDVPLIAMEPDIGRPWPNPARDALGLSLALPRAAEVEWTLYDVAGRRVATLWKGHRGPGAALLQASLPSLPGGVYFSRLALDGRVARTGRIALVR